MNARALQAAQRRRDNLTPEDVWGSEVEEEDQDGLGCEPDYEGMLEDRRDRWGY